MTGTNMCSNFGGFQVASPLKLKSYSSSNRGEDSGTHMHGIIGYLGISILKTSLYGYVDTHFSIPSLYIYLVHMK